MKILLGDFNGKVRRDNIFKPTIGNESLYQENNAASKNLVVKCMMLLHRNIRQCTWTSSVGKIHNQTEKNIDKQEKAFGDTRCMIF